MAKAGEHVELDDTLITWDDQRLRVDNNDFVRCWERTNCGLVTTLLEYDGFTWVDAEPESTACDWYVFQLLTPDTGAELVDVSIEAVEEPPLTGRHIEAVVEMSYPDAETSIRYAVRAYPDATGVRTQLSLRAHRPFGRQEISSSLLESYAERLRLTPSEYQRYAAGYYNDLQHRNHDDTPIMRDETREGPLKQGLREIYDRSNLVSLNSEAGGLVLLKESHKCVNQDGVDTGAFVFHEDDVRVTGLGLRAGSVASPNSWLPHDQFRAAWATWCMPFQGGEVDRQLAIKRFDRARFQPHPEEEVYSRSNTWGTRYPGDKARAAAEQENCLKEIESCADLGIDVLVIDDGWQYPMEGRNQDGHQKWEPDPGRFPQGWTTMRQRAEDSGVDLHLWLPPAQTSLEQIVRNVERGGFTGLKLDFLNFQTRDHIETVVEKIRRVVEYTDYDLRTTWDVTNNHPRLGYYFRREYGGLHVANRKPTFDRDRVHYVAYTPRLILRDMWHLSHYLNLTQIAVTVQDVDKVDPSIRDSSQYSHAYCAAISTVGLPLFLQETHLLEGKAREETRTIMQTWRRHREDMAQGFVFPIGDEPSGASWTGFQCHNPETGEGYVLVFRELDAPGAEQTIPLHFLDGQKVRWTDVLSDARWQDADGATVECEIAEAPGFRWLKYHC